MYKVIVTEKNKTSRATEITRNFTFKIEAEAWPKQELENIAKLLCVPATLDHMKVTITKV